MIKGKACKNAALLTDYMTTHLWESLFVRRDARSTRDEARPAQAGCGPRLPVVIEPRLFYCPVTFHLSDRREDRQALYRSRGAFAWLTPSMAAR